ncbi:MAG: deacetylase [Clostridiales bacterium]|nr:deacetylase [Clostridiales bacterium]
MLITSIKKRIFLTTTCTILAGVIIFIIIFSGGVMEVNAKTKELPIYRVDRDDKKISISFDCAWGVDYTDNLLEIMQEKGINCTFFCVEFWTRKHPDYIKKIADAGHEIGTHSATHPHMSKLSKEKMESELITSTKAIEDITGKKVQVFRAPFGEYNDLLLKTATSLNLFTIQWDVDSLDWKDLSANEIYKRVTERVRSGSIVLFHNQGKHTAQALPKIIDYLLNEGYNFVPITELIYKDNYQIRSDGTQVKNS